MSELSTVQLSTIPKSNGVHGKHGDRWGDWVLNLEPADYPSLDYVGRCCRDNPYWIRLSDLQTWQGLNHWMHHLWEKDWGQESMGDFVKAVLSIVDLPYPG